MHTKTISLHLYKQKTSDMILTKIQNEELDSLKNNIETIERNIENAQTNLEIAKELEDTKKVNSIENAIEFGHMQIKNMLKIQAKAMSLDINLVIDLTFDREYTLSIIEQ